MTVANHVVTYQVTGMTCDHCVRALRTELTAVGGVTDVDVDLGSGVVRVTSAVTLDDVQVRAAVEEAGYEVAS